MTASKEMPDMADLQEKGISEMDESTYLAYKIMRERLLYTPKACDCSRCAGWDENEMIISIVGPIEI